MFELNYTRLPPMGLDVPVAGEEELKTEIRSQTVSASCNPVVTLLRCLRTL